MKAFTNFLGALAACASVAASSSLEARDSLPGATSEEVTHWGQRLSSGAEIYWPGSDGFASANLRWSTLHVPTINVVVVPATENDIAETIKFANSNGIPFLAYNTRHGAITTLGRMSYGIEIYLGQLNTIEIAADGKTAKVGGGVLSKSLTDALWAAGKQTVTGTCECVSLLGPGLGGGHGWLQGHHGLVSDQWVSMNLIRADGSIQTIDRNQDIWWAMAGAGHNFGIVTSVTTKIYDVQYPNWAIETLIFSGDKVEEVYQTANDVFIGKQPATLINWSYWLNDDTTDASSAIIIFYIIQEGADSVDSAYTQAFHDLGPLAIVPQSGSYPDVSGWAGVAIDSIPCQKTGEANPRFPLYLEQYNPAAMKEAYALFNQSTRGNPAFVTSLFMFEGYPVEAVQALPEDTTAFAWRSDNILTAPLITYTPDGAQREQDAANLGNNLRDILHNASGRTQKHTYVNYAYGNETPRQWYGHETWRYDRLRSLKKKYDPTNKFSFFGPIADCSQ